MVQGGSDSAKRRKISKPAAKRKKVYDSLHYAVASIHLASKPHARPLSKAATKSTKVFLDEIPTHMPWIAATLNAFFDTLTKFTTKAIASQKTLLRHTLSHPSSFVYIILHMFFPNAPFEAFIPRHCTTIYRWFSEQRTSTTTSVPHLTDIFTSFKDRKLDMDEIRKKVLAANVWNNIFIHRIHPVPSRRKHISQGKKVVLDLCNGNRDIVPR
jgi:hypothetical protein